MVTELAKGVYWVGVVDWGLRLFHGHELSTHRGSSYNAYLIVDDKIALVDTVWEPFAEELLANIRQVIDPARIDYIIANHSEVDHSGALPMILRHCPNATVYCSKRGLDSFRGHYHADWKLQAVSTGQRLPLSFTAEGGCATKTTAEGGSATNAGGRGGRELVFIEAPMLHWPDSMFTYLTGDNILMPNDAFGQHYATGFRFNDQVDEAQLQQEALKYYVNILTPYSEQVIKKIDEVLALNLPVSMIAPSHGVIWRKDPLQIVHAYRRWAQQQPEASAVILYDTMWQATRKMAEAIADGLAESGVPHQLHHVAVTDRNDVLVDVFKSKAVIIGSPTLNRGLLPSIAPLLEDLRGLRFKNKIGAAFGSYGWAAEGVKSIEEHFAKCGIPLAAPGVGAKWQPGPEDLEKCRQLGRTVAAAVKNKA